MAQGAMRYEIGQMAEISGYDEMDYQDRYGVGEEYYVGDGEEFYVGEEDDIEELLEVGQRRVALRRPAARPVRRVAARGRVVRGVADRRAVARGIEQDIGRRIARGKPVIAETMPTADFEWPLGFDSGPILIAPGASATITANPQVLFKGARLVVPGSIASDFGINDVKVGQRSMFPAVGQVPAEAFSNLSVGVRLKLTTAQVTMQISIDVTNIGLAAARFRATIIGTVAD